MRNYNRLTFEERVKIETYYNLGWTLMHIADKLGRSKSTISREITRYPYSYAAEKAQLRADYQSRNHHFRRRLDENAQLFNVVYRYLKTLVATANFHIFEKEICRKANHADLT